MGEGTGCLSGEPVEVWAGVAMGPAKACRGGKSREEKRARAEGVRAPRDQPGVRRPIRAQGPVALGSL